MRPLICQGLGVHVSSDTDRINCITDVMQKIAVIEKSRIGVKDAVPGSISSKNS